MRDRPLQLMLVDEAPVFRLGLKVWLEQQGDFAVVAEAGKAEEALKGIRSQFQIYQQAQARAAQNPEEPPKRKGWRRSKQPQPQQPAPLLPPIDLVLLDLGMGANGLDNRPGLQLCEQIKAEFPALPVLVLSAEAEPALQAAAKQAGASGYGTRSMSVRLLAQLISQTATEPYAAPSKNRATPSQSTQTPASQRPIDPTQLDPISSNPTELDPAEPDPTEPELAQTDSAQVNPSPIVDPALTNPIQTNPPQASPAQISSTTANSAELTPRQTDLVDSELTQASLNQTEGNQSVQPAQSIQSQSEQVQTAPSQTAPSQTAPSQAPQSPTTQSPTTQPPTTQPPRPQPIPPDRSGRSPARNAPPVQSRQKNSQKNNALSRLDHIPGPLTAMRISMRLSGFQQIDRNIAAVEVAKQQTASWLNRAVLDGKKRELNAARWIVAAFWRTPNFSDSPQSRRRSSARSALSNQPGAASTDWIRIAQQGGYGGTYADMTAARYLDRESLIPSAAAVVAATTARLQARPSEVQNVVFEHVFARLQGPLKNTTQSPLEIDILRADKKLELLYLVLRQLEELLADLRASKVQVGQLDTKASQVVRDLWDAVNTEFFGKYYTVRVSNVEQEVVTLLQQEKPIVEAQVLNKIPMVAELFGHWLFQEQMEINGTAYVATTAQAIARSEQLLENLVIQVANAIVQPLLNRLSDTDSIKKSLYTSRLMSSREIERFRNDLSWRYRKDRIVDEPKAIFESQYNLYVLGQNGIEATSIYAPRRAELDRLRGLPLIVTLALETRDAIAPRLRTAFSLVGSSVVYVLTEVLGRGIGLVGRGVLKGVGNIRQDGRARQQRKRAEYTEPEYEDTPYQEDAYRDGKATPAEYRPSQNDAYVENPYSQNFSEWE